MDQTATLAREFERESHRIDQLIWDAMGLRAGERALFCGFANNINWIRRAAAIGVEVSVVASDTSGMNDLAGIPMNVLRGSTAMLPARDSSFDATVAFHYLHEIDPFFHANVVSELARVGKRCVIVEPAPPGDPLGRRIASLYSRAKRELGQFENYHHIEYWRKLLAIVKPNVTYQTFNFTRTPPREAIRDTVTLIIDMMAAEETPEPYITELRALAKRPDAQLLPQARYVIVGAATGAAVNAGAGTDYREEQTVEPRPVPSLRSDPVATRPPAAAATPNVVPRVYTEPDTAPEFPIFEVARAESDSSPAHSPQIARNAFGLSGGDEKTGMAPPVAATVKHEDSAAAFGVPDRSIDPTADFGWEWDTPPNGS